MIASKKLSVSYQKESSLSPHPPSTPHPPKKYYINIIHIGRNTAKLGTSKYKITFNGKHNVSDAMGNEVSVVRWKTCKFLRHIPQTEQIELKPFDRMFLPTYYTLCLTMIVSNDFSI